MPAPKSQVLRKHVENMVYFVYKYCEIIHEGNQPCHFVIEYYFLPHLFKQVVINIIHKTLEDLPLLELSTQYLLSSDRVDRILQAYMESYTNDFSDFRVIEWATMLCTVSITLYRKGFKTAIALSQETIGAVCSYYRRYEAFTSLGCKI